MDKRFYNNQTPFSHTVVQKPSISAKADISNLGMSAEAKFTAAYGNDETSKETSFYIGMQQGKGAAIADAYKGIGVKVEHSSETVTDTGKRYSSTKVIADLTKLHTDDKQIGLNYLNALSARKMDPEQQAQIEEIYGIFYEECWNLLEEIEANLSWFTQKFNDLSELDENYCYEKPPISHDEYVINTGFDLSNKDDFAKAEMLWKKHLVYYCYDGCYEAAKDLVDYYKEQVDNYENYKKEYIQEQIDRSTKIIEPENPEIHNVEGFDATHLSTVVRQEYGKEKILFKDDNCTLMNGMSVSGLFGLNVCTTNIFTFGADFRAAAEDGLKFQKSGSNDLFSANISGGVVADMEFRGGTLSANFAPGVKFNGGTAYQTDINGKLSVGAGIDGGAVVKRVSTDTFYNAQAQASYKLNPKTTIFGNARFGAEKERIRIGTFDEQTENNITFGASVGAKIGKDKTLMLNFDRKINKINPTRNLSTISVIGRLPLTK